jgi:hypothetical protein
LVEHWKSLKGIPRSSLVAIEPASYELAFEFVE